MGRTHNILKHQIRIARDEIKKKNLKCIAVYVTGKAQIKNCNKDICDNTCLFYPNSQKEYFEYRAAVSDAWRDENIISNEDCPKHLCQHFFTIFAMEKADIIFSPPQLFPIIPPKANLFIDEEIVLHALTPQSVELIELHSKPKHFEIEIPIPEFQTLQERIKQFKKKSIEDKVILQLLAGWEKIATDFEKIARENAAKPIQEIAAMLINCQLEKIKIKKFNLDNPEQREKVAERIKKLTINYYEDVGKYLTALLYGESYYAQGLDEKENENDVEKKNGKITIFLIADERHFFNLEKLKKYEQISLKGTSLAKDFSKIMQTEGFEVVKSENKNFKYALNFWPIYVESTFQVIKGIDGAVSALVLCGSRRDAYYLAQHLDAQFIANKKTSMDRIEYMHKGGHLVLFWNLSAISRGLDLPYFDLLIVYSYQFSLPYEEAKYGPDSTEVEQLKLEETAQSCLRIAPILGKAEDSVKIVILPEKMIKAPVLEDGKIVDFQVNLDLHKRIPYLGESGATRATSDEAIAIIKEVAKCRNIRPSHKFATKSSGCLAPEAHEKDKKNCPLLKGSIEGKKEDKTSVQPADTLKRVILDNSQSREYNCVLAPEENDKKIDKIEKIDPKNSGAVASEIDENDLNTPGAKKEHFDSSLLYMSDMLTEAFASAIRRRDIAAISRIKDHTEAYLSQQKTLDSEYIYLLEKFNNSQIFSDRRRSTESLVRLLAARTKLKNEAKLRSWLNLAYANGDIARDDEGKKGFYWYPIGFKGKPLGEIKGTDEQESSKQEENLGGANSEIGNSSTSTLGGQKKKKMFNLNKILEFVEFLISVAEKSKNKLIGNWDYIKEAILNQFEVSNPDLLNPVLLDVVLNDRIRRLQNEG